MCGKEGKLCPYMYSHWKWIVREAIMLKPTTDKISSKKNTLTWKVDKRLICKRLYHLPTFQVRIIYLLEIPS